MAEEKKQLSSEYDWYLQIIIETVEKGEQGAHIPITLNLGGILLSGKLISFCDYLDASAKEKFSGLSFIAEKLTEKLSEKVAEIKATSTTPPPEDEDESYPTYEFIHLKDARFYSPGGQPWTYPEGLLWRGKASAVTGFMLGEFSIPSS